MAKRIYIAATMQNEGKTTISLGLIHSLKKKFKRVAFIKPLGQRYLIEEGYKIDEDSVLIEKVFNFKCNLKDMSPIAIDKGFTEKYIVNGKGNKSLENEILRSFDRCAKNADLVVIEGTGHAGVGSVLDLSNASVAKLLDAKVILISGGGIGRPIDEIMLNKALFDRQGVEILGVIINKIFTEKYNKINKLVRKGLATKGLNVLGVLPYKPMLSMPNIEEIVEETKVKLLAGKKGLTNLVSKVIIGAMELHNAMDYVEDGSLIITPGDRDDILLMALSAQLTSRDKNFKIAGIILTGGILPNKNVVNLIANSEIPLMFSKLDTYSVASQIYDLTIKLKPKDSDKINTVIDMVTSYVNIDTIIKEISN